MTIHQDPDAAICRYSDCDKEAGYMTRGFCSEHYQEYLEERAEYLYDRQRESEIREREREIND